MKPLASSLHHHPTPSHEPSQSHNHTPTIGFRGNSLFCLADSTKSIHQQQSFAVNSISSQSTHFPEHAHAFASSAGLTTKLCGMNRPIYTRALSPGQCIGNRCKHAWSLLTNLTQQMLQGKGTSFDYKTVYLRKLLFRYTPQSCK